MEFQEFENKIVKIAKLKLPGEAAQFKMAPMERLAALKRIAVKKKQFVKLVLWSYSIHLKPSKRCWY